MNDIPTSDEVDVEKCIKLIRKSFKYVIVKQKFLVKPFDIPTGGLSDMEIEWIKTRFMKNGIVLTETYLNDYLNDFKDPYGALECAKQLKDEYLCTECCFEITRVEKEKYFKMWESQ